jgi:hypothetical protein
MKVGLIIALLLASAAAAEGSIKVRKQALRTYA